MTAPAASHRLSHHALFYPDQRAYRACVGDFVRQGMARGEPAFIAVPGGRAGLLRRQLGDARGQLGYTDLAETGRNPARIIPQLMAFADRHGGRRVRIVTEPAWPGRSAAELREAVRHEALVNVAFAATPASILCLYATRRLDSAAIQGARETHPAIVCDGVVERSPGYAGKGRIPLECEAALPAPPDRAQTLSYRASLRPARLLVAEHASRCGLAADRAASLVLAVGEIAANTLRHTDGPGTLHVWNTRTEMLCELQDQGWITDPLAGRRRRPVTASGQGLWVVNQVCDLVERRTGRDGTITRLHMRLDEGTRHPAL